MDKWPRVFVKDVNADEPWCFCGDWKSEDAIRAIGLYAVDALEEAQNAGEGCLIALCTKEMTNQEVEDIPDL